jgi:hypothetical protein
MHEERPRLRVSYEHSLAASRQGRPSAALDNALPGQSLNQGRAIGRRSGRSGVCAGARRSGHFRQLWLGAAARGPSAGCDWPGWGRRMRGTQPPTVSSYPHRATGRALGRHAEAADHVERQVRLAGASERRLAGQGATSWDDAEPSEQVSARAAQWCGLAKRRYTRMLRSSEGLARSRAAGPSVHAL